MVNWHVRTYNAKSGGWNGTYGFWHKKQARAFAHNHATYYKGAKVEVFFTMRVRKFDPWEVK